MTTPVNRPVKNHKRTASRILEMKSKGEKIACLTAYDFLTARILDECGMDIILIGDSCGMVFSGYDSTIPVTMDDILYHTRAVARAAVSSLVVTDMPFMSYQCSEAQAIENACLCLKNGAHAVKLEGGKPVVPVIKKMVEYGIPVMGHIGLTPQSYHKFGGYPVQGKDEESGEILLEAAQALDEAGVFGMVIEKTNTDIAKKITESVNAATIGIGAGPNCDGQVLVCWDMLGLNETFKPKFLRHYADLANTIKNAFSSYIEDVKESRFPNNKESY